MKQAIIITPFDNYSYQVRIKYVEHYLSERGYEVAVLSSDFDHRNKTRYSAKRDNLELLHVPAYKRNLSFARIKSHYIFAKTVLKRLCDIKPDLIYCSAPPNFLFKYTSIYKRRQPQVKLIYELGDLWPETLPLQKKIKKLASPVLKIWAALRDRNIGYADGIIYECQMFRDVVANAHPNVYSEVIYLSKEDYYQGNYRVLELPDASLRFAYVGSINNIIDIGLIVEILKHVNKTHPAKLVVIGGGEKADCLFHMCDEAGVDYENYGITYDDEKKHSILSTCHFGLNIMKNGVAVGATMKSLEYFHEGLIIVNNIPADSAMIVEQYHCGVNINDHDIQSILEIKDYEQLRMNSRRAYMDLFSTDAVEKKFNAFMDRIKI